MATLDLLEEYLPVELLLEVLIRIPYHELEDICDVAVKSGIAGLCSSEVLWRRKAELDLGITAQEFDHPDEIDRLIPVTSSRLRYVQLASQTRFDQTSRIPPLQFVAKDSEAFINLDGLIERAVDLRQTDPVRGDMLLEYFRRNTAISRMIDLRQAMLRGDVDLAQQIIKNVSKPINNRMRTSLNTAAGLGGHQEIIELLRMYQIYIPIVVLINAVLGGHVQLVSDLLEEQKIQDSPIGSTTGSYIYDNAISSGKREMIDLVLSTEYWMHPGGEDPRNDEYPFLPFWKSVGMSGDLQLGPSYLQGPQEELRGGILIGAVEGHQHDVIRAYLTRQKSTVIVDNLLTALRESDRIAVKLLMAPDIVIRTDRIFTNRGSDLALNKWVNNKVGY